MISTIDDWLDKLDDPQELTDEAKAHLHRILNETLENAERHSDAAGDGNWSIAGFMARRHSSAHTDDAEYVGHLAIVSVGSSIAESISSGPPSTLKELESYQSHHARWGDAKRRENLATVFALQDGNSRVDPSITGSFGGVGMMDMIEFLTELGQMNDHSSSSEIAILSGNSYIKIDNTFLFSKSPNEDLREMWFNSSNSRAVPPADTHVFSVYPRFPGTVISMRFKLDPHFIEAND